VTRVKIKLTTSLNKEQLRQQAIEDFGTVSVPVKPGRQARVLATKLRISPQEALARVREEQKNLKSCAN